MADMALDLYLQKSLLPWRCHREPRLWLNDDEGLFPAPNYLGQQDQKYAVRPGTGRPFHLSPQDDQLLTRTSRFLPQAQTWV